MAGSAVTPLFSFTQWARWRLLASGVGIAPNGAINILQSADGNPVTHRATAGEVLGAGPARGVNYVGAAQSAKRKGAAKTDEAKGDRSRSVRTEACCEEVASTSHSVAVQARQPFSASGFGLAASRIVSAVLIECRPSTCSPVPFMISPRQIF